MAKMLDLTGQRFGLLTALNLTEGTNSKVKWDCICDCGNTCAVYSSNLVRGHTKSCGCLRRQKKGNPPFITTPAKEKPPRQTPRRKELICTDCGIHFIGYPQKRYCDKCIADHRRVSDSNRSKGTQRPLGSIDKCDNCGKNYVVNGGKQKYCNDCKDEVYRLHDQQKSIKYYNQNKDTINPKRNKERQKGEVLCTVCGKAFAPNSPAKTCGAECNKTYRWQQARLKYKNT